MQHRITDSNNLADAEALLVEGGEVVVQFSGATYSESTLQRLNELANIYKNRIEIRFYGHYSSSFDFSTLKQVRSVSNLSVDCLLNASNFEELKELHSLDRLSIGVYNELPEDFLSYPSLENLGSLTVSESKQRKLNLSYLSRFHRLHDLHLVGHTRLIETVGLLSSLQKLGLSQIGSKQKLNFLNSLEGLKKLTVILGGRENLNEVFSQSIEELEVIRVRGVSELIAGNFPRLKRLRVEDQIRLTELSFGSENENLQSIYIGNCKELASLSGLSKLASLERLRVFQTSVDFDLLVSGALPPSLREFAFYSRSRKMDVEIHKKLAAMGYQSGGSS